jgi:hypothetical protein
LTTLDMLETSSPSSTFWAECLSWHRQLMGCNQSTNPQISFLHTKYSLRGLRSEVDIRTSAKLLHLHFFFKNCKMQARPKLVQLKLEDDIVGFFV